NSASLPPGGGGGKTAASFRWSLKVDRVGFLDAFEPADWSGLEEVVVDIARDHPTALAERLQQLAGVLGRDRVRLALPALTRKWEEHGLRLKVEKLREAGWTKWEAANLSAWRFLGFDAAAGHTGPLDLATDWS